MHFNPDLKKQAKEVIFSRKSNTLSHTPLTFNNNDINKCIYPKYLGIALYLKLDFSIHIEQKIKKCYKILGFMRGLEVSLPIFAHYL